MHNEVLIEGELTAAPRERELKSGDRIWTFQVAVPRVSENGVDWVDCSVRAGRLLSSVATWSNGDRLRLVGHLRRRFFRVDGVSRSSLEVTVQSGRRLRRSPTA